MRLAQTNDVWRDLFKKPYTFIEAISVKYREIEDGPELQFSLKGPIALLCGENGVGKSRALRALHQSLGGGLNGVDFRPAIGPALPILLDIYAEINKPLPNGQINRDSINSIEILSESLKDSEGEHLVYWFDPTLQIPYLLHLLRHDASLSDLWEGVSPRKLNAEELSNLSSLVGRTYDAAEIYEIEDYRNHKVVPYFRVTSHGVTYGAEDMGLGELSLLFFFWLLGRVGDNSILLLEEPETFIAPHSQRGLIDLIAFLASKKSIFVVVTSHSGAIAERIPNEHIHLISRIGKEVTFLRNPSRAMLFDRLGLVPPKSIIAFVEDVAAAKLAKALLEVGNSKYMSHCWTFIAGSDGDILTILNKIKPSSSVPIFFIGLFDGDKRKSLPSSEMWETMCLPGNHCPEQFVQNVFKDPSVNLEELLNKSREVAAAALASVDGKNHHDWLVGLSRALPMSDDELFRCAAIAYSKIDPEALKTFICEIEAKVKGRA